MTLKLDSGWGRLLTQYAVLALFASMSLAEERKIVRKVIDLEDCPEVKVLGSGGAHMLSLSPRGFLGVETSDLTPELRRHFGADEDSGVMLSRVVDDSAASAAGLQVGDILTHIDGETIASGSQLGRAIRQLEGGAVVEIEYLRAGSTNATTATVEERKRCSFDIGDYLHTLDFEELPALRDLGIEISGETIENAMKGVRDMLESQDWESHFQHLKDVDLDSLEERMEGVQERLEELEERLEREYGRDVRAEERRERDRKRSRRDREEQEDEPTPSPGDQGHAPDGLI